MLDVHYQQEYARLRNLIPENLEDREVRKAILASIAAIVSGGVSVPISLATWRFGRLFKARTALDDLEELLRGQIRLHGCDGLQIRPPGFPSLPKLIERRFS